MSDTARKLFDSIRAIKDGIQAGLPDALAQGKAEAGRMGTQGSMELASALFNGHGFVPYGPGQYTPSPSQHHQHDRGMER
jgi:hypothetical protein